MIKTLSFATIHIAVAFSIGYMMTGDVLVGGALALVEPLCNSVVFYFHEKAWQRIKPLSAPATTGQLMHA